MIRIFTRTKIWHDLTEQEATALMSCLSANGINFTAVYQ